MTESTPANRRGRGRRPFAEVREDVLTAAAAVLMEEGIRGFTTDKVVTRSGVSSATVYKHWNSRGALALDGYVHAVGDEVALHDTGDIRADLTGILTAFVRMVSRTPSGPVFAQLIAAAQTDSELASQFQDHYFGPRRQQAFELLRAAQDRGQIRRDVDLGTVVDLLWGACYMRLLLPHLTDLLTLSFAGEVVDLALAGVVVAPPARHAVPGESGSRETG